MQADNPFANAVVISDKRARQVYFAIDGKRSIPEVLKAVRMDKEALASALRFLLNEQLIDLYGPDGKPVESSQFLRPF
jgi:predicted transcriptional regulator